MTRIPFSATRLRRSFLQLAVAVFLTSAASAGGILDQEFAPAQSDTFNSGSNRRYAQTFTAGRSGLLTGVEVLISNVGTAGDFILEIQTGVVEGPLSGPMTVLGSISIPLSALPSSSPGGTGPDYVPFDLSSFGIAVAAGEQYAIVLHSTNGDDPASHISWRGGTTLQQGGYSLGKSFLFFPNLMELPSGNPIPPFWGVSQSAEYDFAFRTFVTPEPSTLALTAFGISVLAAWRWRRKR